MARNLVYGIIEADSEESVVNLLMNAKKRGWHMKKIDDFYLKIFCESFPTALFDIEAVYRNNYLLIYTCFSDDEKIPVALYFIKNELKNFVDDDKKILSYGFIRINAPREKIGRVLAELLPITH